jgi:hypothetical protein
MTISPDDYLSARGADARVHCYRDDRRRVFKTSYLRILENQLVDNFPGSIGGPPVDYDDFAARKGIALVDK